jgi:hypothetical protein
MDPQAKLRRMTGRTLAALFLVVAGTTGVRAQHAAPAVDERERIVLPAPARNMVLAEMRMMLESVTGVVTALSEGDTAAAAEAARASGMVMAVDPHLVELLPAAFVELGMATHRGFDALADQLEQGADQGTALAELGTLMQNCNACHATYRADEAP